MTAKNTAQRAFAVMSGPEQGGPPRLTGPTVGGTGPAQRAHSPPRILSREWRGARLPAYSPGFAFHNPDGELRLFQGRSSKETSSDVRQTDSRGPVLT